MFLQVTVEYGADLHSSVHGSGFPMCDNEFLDRSKGSSAESEEFKYSKSGWNLNNIPNLKVRALYSTLHVHVVFLWSCFC